jgi:hypothetical protein
MFGADAAGLALQALPGRVTFATIVFMAYAPGGGCGTRKEVSGLLKLSKRKVVASAFIGMLLAAGVPFAGADRGGGPGSNHGCPGHQPPPPPHGGCGH